jgi:tetratricopeptide (TPR) repeat protein
MMRAFIISTLSLSLLYSQVTKTGGITWLRNFEDSKREALFQTKLILIFFERNSLEDGYKMETETWNQEEIINLSKEFICLRIDMQQWKSLADQYDRIRTRFRVDVVPTTIITDPLGNEFYHEEGFVHAADLQKVMKALPRNLFSVYQAIKMLDAQPNSISSKINVGIAYHRIRVAHISNKLLEEVIGSDTLKRNPTLEENVETYRAINYQLLGEIQKSINLFEILLDRFPHEEKQPVHLYYLAKLYLQDFNETQAKKYLRILQRQFPNHTYTKQAEDLFKK